MNSRINSYGTIIRVNMLFSLFVGIGLAVLAVLDYQASRIWLSLCTLALSAVLLISAGFLAFNYKLKYAGYLDKLLIILIASYSLVAATNGGEQNTYWIYFFPVVALFLFKLGSGILLTLLYMPIALYVIKETSLPLHEAQIFFSFAVVIMVSIFLAFVKTRTNNLLAPLVGQDLSTGAQLGKFLRPALSIEINRAEREGTGLLLMHINTPLDKKELSQEEFEESVALYAQAISKNLRDFDQYYRLNKQNFTIILPHATSQEAKITAQNIIQDVGLTNANKATFGLASLNVGDTADSLIHLSQKELNHV
jgi:hypothetical protein